jgi:cytoskeletal protein RodZ
MDTLESTLKGESPFVAERLADQLREARKSRGLELSDVAEITNVRKDYLQALEEGRYEALPENVYAKNFLRLFAKAVGLDGASVLERYNRERGQAPEAAREGYERTEPHRREASYRDYEEPRRFVIAGWLPVLVLIAAVVGVGVWVFNNYLFTPTDNIRSVPEAIQPQTPLGDVTPEAVISEGPGAEVSETVAAPEITEPAVSETAATAANDESSVATSPQVLSPELAASVPSEIKLSLITNPPGAEVSLDNYAFPGTTPFFDAPISSGENRLLRIELEGYEPYEEQVDLLEDSRLIIDLTAEEVAETTAPEVPQDAVVPVPLVAGQGQVNVTIEEETWFEAYQSTARGEGERLVYATLTPGTSYAFNLPVYIHVGNAGGVQLSLNGQDIGAMGSSGEVLGRAFGEAANPAATQEPGTQDAGTQDAGAEDTDAVPAPNSDEANPASTNN